MYATASDDAPICRLIAPRGVGLQVYLVALFEAQCLHRSETIPANNRVLRASEPDEIGWLDLIASVADADTAKSINPVTEQGNLLRQVKAALRALSMTHLVSLSGDARRVGRFEKFTIGHESGSEEFISYAVPRLSLPGLIELPADFFLNGWVHVLSSAEIATYLMFCDLAYRFPQQHKENGVYVSGAVREQRYGIRRDIYEAHRLLTLFEVLDHISDPKRWPNGKIRNFREVVASGERMSSHRFRLIEYCFEKDALGRVCRLLGKMNKEP